MATGVTRWDGGEWRHEEGGLLPPGQVAANGFTVVHGWAPAPAGSRRQRFRLARGRGVGLGSVD